MIQMKQLLSTATSGRRADVEPLCGALGEIEFLVPALPREESDMGAGPELIQDFQDLTQSSDFQPHVLQDEQDRPFLPVCSDQEAMSDLPNSESDEVLEAVEMDGDQVFALAQDLYERGEVEGMVIDLFQDTELRLNPDEIENWCDGNPVPLKDHLRGEDVEEEQIEEMNPPEDHQLPDSFLEILNSYVEADDALQGFECAYGVNPAVDRRPHVILNLLTEAGVQVHEEERAHEIYVAVSDYLPSPGFIEVVFDRSVDHPIAQG